MLRQVAFVTIISAITRAIAFVFKIYLSRALGAEILGVYQIAMSIFVLLMAIPSSGIPTALSRHLAALNAKGDNSNARGMLTSALIASTILAIIIVAICYLFPNLTSLLFSDKRCLDMFLIMLPALISTSIYAIIRSYFFGNKLYFIYSISELLEEILSVITIFIALAFTLFSSDISVNIAIAFVISDYVATILLVILFYMKGGRLARPTMMRELRRSSTPMTSTRLLGSLVSSMMALLIPTLLVKYGMTSGEATACYGRASGMVMPLIFIPSTIISALLVVLIPELAEARSKDANLTYFITNAINLTMVVACLFLAIFIASGESITYVLYDDAKASAYIRIACYLMLPMSLNQMVASILNTLGDENATFVIHILGSILLLIIIVIMPKHIGIYAYFVGLIAFHSLTFLAYILRLRKKVSIDKKLTHSSLILLVFTIIIGYLMRYSLASVHNALLSSMIGAIIVTILYGIFIIRKRYISLNILHIKGDRKVKNFHQK